MDSSAFPQVRLEALGPRVAVVGSPGAGKTTLARELAAAHGLPHIELDSLFWGLNWTEASREAFRERLVKCLEGGRWIADGNFAMARDLIWGRATDLLWLDYALPLTLYRLVRRTFSRVGCELWNGNRENFRDTLLRRDSLLTFTLRTFRQRRREFATLLASAEYGHLRARRFRTPEDCARWLADAGGGNSKSARPLRIGVYGGTFDPVHNVHLDIARAAVDQAGLDRLLFVVSARPPHKQARACATPEERYAMVSAAVEGKHPMEASRIELDRNGPSYTADTLRQLRREQPEAELFLIMGVDSLADLMKWREPEVILSLATILAVPRPGDWHIPPELEGRYRMLDFPAVPVSSTEVRHRIAEGEPLDNLVPAPVKQYIQEKGLYDVCV
jgi:nicotinate-nucleotide adenylyltransferase